VLDATLVITHNDHRSSVANTAGGLRVILIAALEGAIRDLTPLVRDLVCGSG